MTTAQNAPPFPAEELWRRLDPTVPFKGDWIDFRYDQQAEFLQGLARYSPIDVGLSFIGVSEEGRTLQTLRFGRGKRRVMVWARQHGNEPDCTAGLCMALYELAMRAEDPLCELILDRLELGVLPMVNPDGVARFTRYNANGIDINRDAVALSSSEGRALFAIRDSLRPEYCFNLHDMGPRKSTPTGELVALAFQAGPFEPRDIDNPVRLRAKHVIGLMDEAVRAHAPANTAKYTADYMHRAFGDSMMRWGVSSILIEAGGWYADRGGDDFVRRLFALSLLRGLYAIAAGEDAEPDGEGYARIPFDSGKLLHDVVLEKAQVLNGLGMAPFRADVSINVHTKPGLPQDPIRVLGTVEQIGDLEDDLSKTRLSLEGRVLLPGFLAIAPSLPLDGERPSEETALKFLRAGVTTVACGFGPFASTRAREAWMGAAARKSPPINVIAFERVTSLREIRARHGMSELAGLLVQDLTITPEDLLQFTNLFHPITMPEMDYSHSGRLLGLDVFFQASPSPSGALMHLHLSHVESYSGEPPVRPEELRVFVEDLLRSPSQVTLSMDSAEQPFDWLPMMVGFGGLSRGRVPARNFLGHILRSVNARDAESVVTSLSVLAMQNARAFRMGNVGTIQRESRADIVAYDLSLLSGGEAAWNVEPQLVISNGAIVLDRSSGIERTAAGVWSFAATAIGRG